MPSPNLPAEPLPAEPGATFIFAAVLSLVASRVVGSLVFPAYDDAFITFRYARQFAETRMLVYNSGEWVLGTTAPLFALIQSMLVAWPLSLEHSVVYFNIIVDAGILVLSTRLAKDARVKDPHTWLLIFLFLFSVNPSLARISAGAMEMNLFLLVSLSSILLSSSGRTLPAFGILAVAYFLRPEALLIIAVLGVTLLVQSKWRAASLSAALVSCILATGLAFIASAYGSVIPQSVSSKALIPRIPLLDTFRYLLAPEPLSLALVPFFLYGAVKLFARTRLADASRMFMWAVVAFLLAFAIAGQMIWSWYGETTLYGLVFFSSLGLAFLLERVEGLQRYLQRRRLRAGLIALAPVLWLSVLLLKGKSTVRTGVYDRMQSWCATHVQPTDSVFAWDVGAIGYYCRARIIDAVGLVTPADMLNAPMSEEVLRYEPTFVLVNATPSLVSILRSDGLEKMYDPVVRFSASSASELYPKQEELADGWSQDYILYQRRLVEQSR